MEFNSGFKGLMWCRDTKCVYFERITQVDWTMVKCEVFKIEVRFRNLHWWMVTKCRKFVLLWI